MATPQGVVPAKFLPVGGEMFLGSAVLTVGTKVPAILWPTVEILPNDVIEREVAYQKQRRLKSGERPLPLDLARTEQLKLEREKFAAAATALEIRTRGNRAVILETGSLGAPIKTFENPFATFRRHGESTLTLKIRSFVRCTHSIPAAG